MEHGMTYCELYDGYLVSWRDGDTQWWDDLWHDGAWRTEVGERVWLALYDERG